MFSFLLLRAKIIGVIIICRRIVLEPSEITTLNQCFLDLIAKILFSPPKSLKECNHQFPASVLWGTVKEPFGLELVAAFSGFSLKSAMRSVSPASSGLPFQNQQLSGMDGVCLIFPHDFVTSLCMCICLIETFLTLLVYYLSINFCLDPLF